MNAKRKPAPDSDGKYVILFDQHCRLCTTSTHWVRRFDVRRRFDYGPQELGEGDDRSASSCQRELQLLCPDGTVLTGWTAVTTIARKLPLVSWFGLLASVKPIHALGTVFYRWLARNRYRFGKTDRDRRKP